MTVRSMVESIRREIRDTDLTPERASALAAKLTALMGNCSDEQRAADMAYKRVLLDCLSRHEKANRARIEAEVSPEFERAREAKDTFNVVVEMIRSLRQILRTAAEEMRMTR